MNPPVFRNILIALALTGCIEPYDPPTSKETPDYLVVDGFIDATANVVTVSLTHTMALNSTDGPLPVLGATVRLLVSDGSSFDVTDTFNGVYSASVPVSFEKQYTLYIQTAFGKEYQSDPIAVRQTPEIDSINYVMDQYGDLNINVNTHDVTGQSRFYRWRYEQTFMYRSQYASSYIIRAPNLVEPREPSEYIEICYKTDYLSRILVGTTKLLTEDVVINANLVKFSKGAFELSEKYSLLVKQQTLTEEAYDYWLNIKKTTESLGGLFDPLPGEVTGNIRSITDPGEPVIGYFNGSEVSEKRIFISKFDLPDGYSYFRYPYCDVDSILNESLGAVPVTTLLIAGIYPPGALRPIGYTTAPRSCIDCRLTGGVLTVPPFWE
jgi:hypothetical protein